MLGWWEKTFGPPSLYMYISSLILSSGLHGPGPACLAYVASLFMCVNSGAL